MYFRLLYNGCHEEQFNKEKEQFFNKVFKCNIKKEKLQSRNYYVLGLEHAKKVVIKHVYSSIYKKKKLFLVSRMTKVHDHGGLMEFFSPEIENEKKYLDYGDYFYNDEPSKKVHKQIKKRYDEIIQYILPLKEFNKTFFFSKEYTKAYNINIGADFFNDAVINHNLALYEIEDYFLGGVYCDFDRNDKLIYKDGLQEVIVCDKFGNVCLK